MLSTRAESSPASTFCTPRAMNQVTKDKTSEPNHDKTTNKLTNPNVAKVSLFKLIIRPLSSTEICRKMVTAPCCFETLSVMA